MIQLANVESANVESANAESANAESANAENQRMSNRRLSKIIQCRNIQCRIFNVENSLNVECRKKYLKMRKNALFLIIYMSFKNSIILMSNVENNV